MNEKQINYIRKLQNRGNFEIFVIAFGKYFRIVEFVSFTEVKTEGPKFELDKTQESQILICRKSVLVHQILSVL